MPACSLPPLSVEAANVWPGVMGVAVGQVLTVGVALFTVWVSGLLVLGL